MKTVTECHAMTFGKKPVVQGVTLAAISGYLRTTAASPPFCTGRATL